MGRAPKTPGVEIHLLLASQALELMGVSASQEPSRVYSIICLCGGALRAEVTLVPRLVRTQNYGYRLCGAL